MKYQLQNRIPELPVQFHKSMQWLLHHEATYACTCTSTRVKLEFTFRYQRSYDAKLK